MEFGLMTSPVSFRGSTPELSTPTPTLEAPLLSPLCADTEAWELDLTTTPEAILLRFGARSPSCSPEFSGESSEGSEEGRRSLSWLMDSDSVDADGLRKTLGSRDSCQADARGASGRDLAADTWMSDYPGSWEGLDVGADVDADGMAAPCSRPLTYAAEEIPLPETSNALSLDSKQDCAMAPGHEDREIIGDLLDGPSPEKFSLDRVTSALCNATAAADLTAFLDELEGECSTGTPPAQGHMTCTAAQQQALHEPFPGGDEEGSVQDVLGALVGTMSYDSLADSLVDSLVDVRYTTSFGTTSSSYSHSGRSGNAASDWEGEGDASLGSEPITWTFSASDLDMLQDAAGGADTLSGDAELLDDSWIDCLLDSDAFNVGDPVQETGLESVEGRSQGAVLPLPGAASVRESVREVVRDVVGLARCKAGLALGGGAGEGPALAPALRAAVARLALDAARTKALKTNKASVRQAVLRASAALESASCLQEEGGQSPEEGAAAVRRALVGRLTTWSQALGIPGAQSSPSSTPGASSGTPPLSASQRAAHLRRAVALARGKEWPPSAGALEQGRGRGPQGSAPAQGSGNNESTSMGAAAAGESKGPSRLPLPAPVSAPETSPTPPFSAPEPVAAPPYGASLRDRIKYLLGDAARPQRSPSPPASGSAPPLPRSAPAAGAVSLPGGASSSGCVSLSRAASCSGAVLPWGSAPMSRTRSSVFAIPGAAAKGVEGGTAAEKGREQEQRRSVESAVSFLSRKRSSPGEHTGGAPAGGAKAGRQGQDASPATAARRAQLLAAAISLGATCAHGAAAEGRARGAPATRGTSGVPASGWVAAAVRPQGSVGSVGTGGSSTSAGTALAAALRNPKLAVPSLPDQKRAFEGKGTGGSGTAGSLPARLALLARDVQRRQPLL